uniref:Uncharacterized protein n=1 Tax=Aegilops tauschii TaxID=37682 RepID=M8BCM0_AEGTA
MAMSSTSLLKRCSGIAQSRKGCRYDPERAGIGIVSAIMEPTNAHLHIVGPLIHTNAHEILEVTLPNLIWSNRRPFRAAILSCGLCRSWIGSGTVYMYKGETGFCKPECVNDYIVEQLEKQTRRLRWCQREKVPPMEDDKEGNQSSMFFTCAEAPIPKVFTIHQSDKSATIKLKNAMNDGSNSTARNTEKKSV